MTPDKIYLLVPDAQQYHSEERDYLEVECPDEDEEILEYTLTRRGTVEMVRSINWEVL